jgi:2-polyprenyl-6-hydroxyphenyl methylase/3-demethylubiquinone-9 3-methyltransferase
MRTTKERQILSEAPISTVNAREIEQFATIAHEWWNPEGKFKPLHRLNPARLGYIRRQAVAHFGLDDRLIAPFGGLSLLDVGCGGGLIAEPMARLGFAVTGIDAAEAGLDVASAHAKAGGLAIDYRLGSVETLAATEPGRFDVVLALEIVEHVEAPDLFLQTLAHLVKPGGLLILSTINRTTKALVLAKFGAEYVLGWLPPGTHDWKKFMKPSELAGPLRRAGLDLVDVTGLVFDPATAGWKTGPSIDMNYLLAAVKP